MTKILFLDIDGCLNGHEKHPDSPYTTIRPDCVQRLNSVVKATDCKIVISSAWRYMMLRPRKNRAAAMTLLGFQYMLHTHGLMTHNHKDMSSIIIGHTCSDEEIATRGKQVLHWIRTAKAKIEKWAAVDDIDFRHELGKFAPLVVTDSKSGIQGSHVKELVKLLGG